VPLVALLTVVVLFVLVKVTSPAGVKVPVEVVLDPVKVG